MSQTQYWPTGNQIVYREVWRDKVWTASIRAEVSPFNDGWENWFPDPEWPIPSLSDGWDKV